MHVVLLVNIYIKFLLFYFITRAPSKVSKSKNTNKKLIIIKDKYINLKKKKKLYVKLNKIHLHS